ncbi:recombinase family protein [Patescibacteria group bacterium]|nr:recombinase family protein [Patescibacteria group bacterium]
MRQKIRNGVWPVRAPDGYLNNSQTRMIDIDPEKAPKIRKLFEFYATGEYNLKSLANWCKENNLKGHLNKEMAVSNIQKILQNIFYLGLMKYKGEVFEGKHVPLISKKLFDKVQQVLQERGRPQKIKNHNFAFLGLMKCASCGCAITAEIQKGHHYYHCTKKKGPCPEKHFLREEALVEQIKNYLQKVSLSSQDTKKVLVELEKDELKAKEQTKIVVQNLKKELAEIEIKLEKLLDVYLNEVISTEEYTARKQKILTRKLELQEKIRDFEQKGLSWLEPDRGFILKLNYAEKLLKSENKEEITTFLKNIGSNHILQNQKLIFSLNSPFSLAAERSEAANKKLTFSRRWT